MTQQSNPDDPIDPSLLEELGRIVTAWSTLDSLLGEWFAWLSSADRGAMYVATQNVAASTLQDWIRTLCRIRFQKPEEQDRLDEAESLLTAIADVRQERNRLVHGVWRSHSKPGTALVQTVRWERADVVVWEYVTQADLHEVSNATRDLLVDLIALGRREGFLGASGQQSPSP